MAALTAATVAILVHRVIVPYISNNWYKGSKLLTMLWEQRKTYDGGARISVPCSYESMGKATSWDGGIASDTIANSLPVKEAYFGWKYYRTYWAWEMQEAVKYSGKNSAVDVALWKAKQSANDLNNRVATDLFDDGTETDGSEGTLLTGLAAICQAADPGSSHNYGGLAYASNTWWGGLDVSKSSTTYGGDGTNWVPSRDKLEKIIMALSYNMSDRPDLLVCDDDSFRSLKALFYDEAYVNYNDPKKPDLSFNEFTIAGGIKVIWDSYCTDKTIYVLNTKHLWLAVHPDFQMAPSQKVSMEPAGYAAANVQYLKLACNLVTDNRGRHARIRDIATN